MDSAGSPILPAITDANVVYATEYGPLDAVLDSGQSYTTRNQGRVLCYIGRICISELEIQMRCRIYVLLSGINNITNNRLVFIKDACLL